MKMKQLGVIDTLKPSPQKIKVPAKACTLLKQSVTSFTLRMGEHPDLIPLLKIGESPNLGESPQNQQPTLAALCCNWAVLQGRSQDLHLRSSA